MPIPMTTRSNRPRIVIIGGGMTGLSLAHGLANARNRQALLAHEAWGHAFEPHIRLIESSDRLGGNLVTEHVDGFTIDGGPDSWVAAKPQASQLARAVGLGQELIGTREDTRHVYLLHNRELLPMPAGLILGVPTEWRSLASTSLLPIDAKARALLDWIVPRKTFATDDDDESISAFVERRLGAQMNQRLVGPLLGGIFAGDPELLSVRACTPQLVEAEQSHGSLIRAMRDLASKRKMQSARGEGQSSPFVSLRRGVEDLVTHVRQNLHDANTPVELTTRRAVQTIAPLDEDD